MSYAARSGHSAFSFSTVRNSCKKLYESSVSAQTPQLAFPPLSPDRVPNSLPKGTFTVSPVGAGESFTGGFLIKYLPGLVAG